MKKRDSIKVTRSNKRERTVTITKDYADGTKTVYKSIPLSKQEFAYYTEYATENDLRQFLNTTSGEYYILKPNR